VISAYHLDKEKFMISPFMDSDPIRIRPDLVFYLSDGRKVAVEVANPKSPKRFIGELISPHFLVYSKEVDTAIVFVLPYGEDRKVQQIFNRPLVQDIALGQNVISSPKIITIHLDISKPEKTCYILYDSLKDYQAQRKFY